MCYTQAQIKCLWNGILAFIKCLIVQEYKINWKCSRHNLLLICELQQRENYFQCLSCYCCLEVKVHSRISSRHRVFSHYCLMLKSILHYTKKGHLENVMEWFQLNHSYPHMRNFLFILLSVIYPVSNNYIIHTFS